MTHKRRKKHEGRDDLAGEHPLGDRGQVIILITFIVSLIADILFHFSDFLRSEIPLFIRIPVSLPFLALSLYLARSGLNAVFGKVREKPEVIKEGAFSHVRHPIYLSVILLYLGIFIIFLSIPAFAVWLFAFAFYYYISRYEEKILLEVFGKEYEKYMKEVPMFIPRLFK